MRIWNTITLPGMLTPIAARGWAGYRLAAWNPRTSGSGYGQLYNLLDAGDFAQNLTVECSDLCGVVTGDA